MKENDKINDKKKIILLNGSEIMRSMLIRAIEGQSSMVIDREIKAYSDLGKISSGGLSLDADWLITIEKAGILTEDVMTVMEQNPRTRFLILARDGSKVTLHCYKKMPQVVQRLDLPDLLKILSSEK